ncbi:MAG TPA: GGDEF domain-containing protein [Thermoleophilaceae bacterium]|jgi:diguanylate cyclase (GGDEF)-like protein
MTARRDSEMYERDRVAEGRDRMADRRDRVAEGRDRAAEQRDRAGRRFSKSEPERASDDRGRAAGDRADAAGDRRRAAEDRRQAARDRAEAGIDDLTGALRRDRGLTDLAREIDRARRSDGRLVLAFVDVDGLKAVNDVEGHAAGDKLLRDAALALRSRLRSYDLVIRFGGDEFLCALAGTDVKGARRRFDEVTSELTERNPRASVSTGFAELEHPDTLDDLIARADAALYAGRRRLAREGAATQPRG